jgi:hypothetical protein
MTDQATDTTRWRGFTHKELYKLLHEGGGPASSGDSSRRWAEISATLSEVSDDLQAALDKSGSGWKGKAAGAAYDRLSGLVDWASSTGAGAATMRTAVDNQAQHLATARAQMPVPDDTSAAPPDPTTGLPAAQLVAGQADAEPVEAAASAGQQRAFEVMTTYQKNTTANTTALASFNAPSTFAGLGDIQRHTGGGVSLTTPAIAVGVGVGPVPQQTDQLHTPGIGGLPHGDGWLAGGGATIGAGSLDVEVGRRPLAAANAFTMAAPVDEPFFALGVIGEDSSGGGRTSTGTGGPGATGAGPGPASTALGAGTGASPAIGAGPNAAIGAGGQRTAALGATPGTSGLGLGGSAIGAGHSPDLQTAVAGQHQMATAAGTPAAAAPGAAAGTGIPGSGDTHAPVRRLGVDPGMSAGQALGSDLGVVEVRGASTPSRRRFTDRDNEQRVTEQVSIDGEQHSLPPTVIGE